MVKPESPPLRHKFQGLVEIQQAPFLVYQIHYTLECTSNLYDFNGARGFGVTCLSPVQGTSRRRGGARAQKDGSLFPAVRCGAGCAASCGIRGPRPCGFREHPPLQGRERQNGPAQSSTNFELMRVGFPTVIVPVDARPDYYRNLDIAATQGDYLPFVMQIAELAQKSFAPYWALLGE